jgi:hypothetical protein
VPAAEAACNPDSAVAASSGGGGGSGVGSGGSRSGGGSDGAQLARLSDENAFLRERVSMVEASVQPLLLELAERRELLHSAYVLCHRALLARDAAIASVVPPDPEHDGLRGTSMEAVSAWARAAATPPARADAGVEDAMEAVLEDSLRACRRLEAELTKATTEMPTSVPKAAWDWEACVEEAPSVAST